MQVIPVFAGGLDFSLPVKKFFYDPLGSGKSFINCAVSLTGEHLEISLHPVADGHAGTSGDL